MGNFYDHTGADTWCYFVYVQVWGKKEKKAQNEVASRACGRPQYGDVAIIRSGPAGFDTPETFTKSALVKALEFYKTHESSAMFAERERNRMGKTTGLDLSGVTSIDATNWDFSRPIEERMAESTGNGGLDTRSVPQKSFTPIETDRDLEKAIVGSGHHAEYHKSLGNTFPDVLDNRRDLLVDALIPRSLNYNGY
ncbi:MAG: hypothetical protein Q9207_003751 [Kuettlingeria erythrocarpa]